MTPKVSVILCTYNAEKYIQATLESVLNQSYTDIEVLILDNFSTDTTLVISQKFTDKRVHIFPSKKNLGPYGWLNFLLKKAKGEYIAIQDHDDIRHPQKIEKQINFLEKHKKYVWCGTKTLMRYEWDQMGFEYYLGKENYYTIHPSLVFRNATFDHQKNLQSKEFLDERRIPTIWEIASSNEVKKLQNSKTVRWKKYRYPDTVYMADALFQKKILCKWKKLIYNLDETLTMHRVRSGASNYSYKWYKFTWKNLQTVFGLHPLWYAVFATLFELMRKIIYPILHFFKISYLIDRIERVPFRLQGYKVRKYSREGMKKMGFVF